MPQRRVRASAQSATSPDALWSIAGDFCAPWHPMVASMRAEVDPSGRLIRAFKVAGEDRLYRERLTYLSHSGREMRYLHREGIAGAKRYAGRLTIAEEGAGSRITLEAQLEAEAPRCDAIAAGTQAVFDAGVAALTEARPPQARGQATPPPPVPLQDITLEGAPRLGLTATPAGSDTLVLFLHGIGGNRDNWRAQLQAVAPFARAAALDLRGYGGSDLGPEQSTVQCYGDDILRVVAALGAKHLILVGLSYGAWIATSFALRHPDRLRGLVLAGGCTGMSEAGPEERAAFRTSREVPLDAGQTPADFAPAVVDVIAGPEASTAVRTALQASMAAIPAASYRDALRCFTHPLARFDFARLTVPVLLMTGAHDRLAPPAEIGAVAERIWQAAPTPDVQFEVIAGAGHVCNLEQGAAFDAHLTGFVHRIAQ